MLSSDWYSKKSKLSSEFLWLELGIWPWPYLWRYRSEKAPHGSQETAGPTFMMNTGLSQLASDPSVHFSCRNQLLCKV